MEDNKLELNEKFCSFDGVIGRYGYFFNMIIITVISSIFQTPYMLYIGSHIENPGDFFGKSTFFTGTPILLQIWTLIGLVGVCYLIVSNMHRRLNDITGKVNINLNRILLFLFVFITFGIVFLPLWLYILLSIYSFVLGIVLLFKGGKISSTLPYDFKKEFNWGAFFGTWIWGLFNKSYVTLWHLLLWFTPLDLYFRLFCGLKGNKWAYENKNCDDVEKFNKSQEKQTLIFILLNFIIVPIIITISIVFVFALFAFIGASNYHTDADANYANQSAGIENAAETDNEKSENVIDNFLNGMVSVYFDKYEITENENKFYVQQNDWKWYSFKEKIDLLRLAASTAADEKRKIQDDEIKKLKAKGVDEIEILKEKKYFSQYDELPNTKIYSIETNQLLAEYNLDESEVKGSFVDEIKATMKAYKFYNVKK